MLTPYFSCVHMERVMKNRLPDTISNGCIQRLFNSSQASSISASLVRFGKRGFGHNLQSGTVQIMRAQIESRFNVPQSSPVSELGKAHHKKLVPAIELDGMSVASVALDTLAEFIFRNERHKLREDCFSFIHCLREMSLWSSCKLTCSNRKIILLLYLAII